MSNEKLADVSPLDTSEAQAKMMNGITGDPLFTLTEVVSLEEARAISLERQILGVERGLKWIINAQNDELMLRASVLRKRETLIGEIYKAINRALGIDESQDERGVKDRVKGMTQ